VICPLSNVREACAKENCAWWDSGSECCAVKGTYDSLYYINEEMKRANGDVKVNGD
jgi:hypothetical protein